MAERATCGRKRGYFDSAQPRNERGMEAGFVEVVVRLIRIDLRNVEEVCCTCDLLIALGLRVSRISALRYGPLGGITVLAEPCMILV